MISNSEVFEFVQEIEDPESREVVLGLLMDIYKFGCPVKATMKLIDIVFDDEFLRRFYYIEIKEFIMKMFNEVDKCEYYNECTLVNIINVEKFDDEVSIKGNIRKKCTSKLGLLLTAIKGLKKKNWECFKVFDSVYMYGYFLLIDVKTKENVKQGKINKFARKIYDMLDKFGFDIDNIL